LRRATAVNSDNSSGVYVKKKMAPSASAGAIRFRHRRGDHRRTPDRILSL